MPNIYKEAVEVQNACNLSGVIKAWARAVDAIWVDVRADNGGTDAFNNHPVNVLFASKVHSLTGYEQQFTKAYEECLVKQDRTFTGYDGKEYTLGDRIELHPSTDLWKQGARFGKVIGCSLTPNDRVRVRLDKFPDAQPFAGTEETFKKV
jgi:hypothetical protein